MGKRNQKPLLTKLADVDNLKGKWAVFRAARRFNNAKFACIHDLRETAVEEAHRLTAEFIARNPDDPEVRYMVLYVDGACGLHKGQFFDDM